MEIPEQQQYSIRDFLTVFFRHKYKILVSFLLAIGISCAVSYQTSQQPQYSAKAVLMVKFGREFVQVSEVGDRQPTTLGGDAIINTEMQILTSRDLIGKVVDRIGIKELYPQLGEQPPPVSSLREIAVVKFGKNMDLNQIRGSNLIEVHFKNENPAVAASAVNALVEFFKEKHLQVFSDSKSTFLEAKLSEYDEKLRKSETDIETFKHKNQIFSLDEQRAILLRTHADIQATLTNEQLRLRELQEKMDFLKDHKSVLSDDATNDRASTELKMRLNTMEQKEKELSQKYQDGNRMMINHQQEMQLVREQLQKQEEKIQNAQIMRIQAEIEPLQVKIAGLKRRHLELGSELQQIDSRSRGFQDLKREIGVNEINYQTYLKKSEESRISEDLDRKKMTNIQVIEQAAAPIVPEKSKTDRLFAYGVLLSIALSLGLAFAAEYIPQCLTTPQSAEKKLDAPILVAITHKPTARSIAS